MNLDMLQIPPSRPQASIALTLLMLMALVFILTGCEQISEHPATKPVSRSPESQTAAAEAIHFKDVTASSGLNMVITCGNAPADQIVEVNGGGMGLIDFDNDGDLDAFVANGATMDDPEHGPGCRLFENISERTASGAGESIKFRDVTARSGIDIHRWAAGVAVGDYDNDGRDDLYITCFGPNILLHDDGQGRFSDVTEKAGVGDPRWGTTSAWGDVDGDGDLDLYVANYLEFDVHKLPGRMKFKDVEVMAGPQGLIPQHDVLYENQGDGTFRDITKAAGCVPPIPGYGLNVVILDFDGDGRQDIYVANDSTPSFLFHNLGVRDGHVHFEEIGGLSGIASNADGANQACMGVGIADVDGNGRPDKFTTVFSSDSNSLHLNMDGRFFEDRAQQFGLGMVSRPFLGWGCGFYDFDHDGDEDLLMVNGHVYPQASMETMDSEYLQPPLLFERKGKRFARVSPDVAGPWLAEKRRDRNAVFGDLDNDGDIDVIIGELNGPIRILQNDGANRSGSDWLIVELRDDRPTSKNRNAFGSRVELIVQKESETASKQTRWVYSGGSFQSSNARYVHFAVPENAQGVPLSLNITWPDGTPQRIEEVKPRQHLIVSRK